MNLLTEIYQLTNSFPNHERFGLMSPMQHAAVSIPTNIAEGAAKTRNKDFALFFRNLQLVFLLELETEITIALN